jgi:hypothetical protein
MTFAEKCVELAKINYTLSVLAQRHNELTDEIKKELADKHDLGTLLEPEDVK